MFINIYFSIWVNIWLFSQDIAVGEVGVVVVSDVAVAGAGEGGGFSDFGGHVFGYIADVVAIRSKYLDGVGVVCVGRFRLQSTNKFADVFGNVLTVRNASDWKFNGVEL